tara:strand:+ start:79 stop:276 length:198 start_codon:yes stop_codon:yes gene_type:complete
VTLDAKESRSSVEFPIADTVATNLLPEVCDLAIFFATFFINSGVAREEPPYFWIIIVTNYPAYLP